MEIDELRTYLVIDKTRLDENLMEHPDLYFRVSDAASIKASLRDRAYETIKRTDASLATTIREQIVDEKGKATEAMVSQAVLDHREHKKAIDRHLDLKEEAAKLDALCEAFKQRGYMLREMVQLYISGYYSDVTARSSQHTMKEVKHGENREKMSVARKRKRITE